MSEAKAFQAYCKFLALKQHFSKGSYDYFKYNGSTRSSLNSFKTKKDRFFYEKVSRKYDENELVEFFVSNLIDNQNVWIGELARNTECDEKYISWKKRIQALTYNFKSDILTLKEKTEDFNELFVSLPPYTEYPKLFDIYQERDIQLETIIGIDTVLGCFENWNRNYKGDIIWDDFYHLCKQYTPFLKYDVAKRNRFKKVLREEFS